MSCLVVRIYSLYHVCAFVFFFFQAEDGIRDLVRSRGLGDVYKRQVEEGARRGRVVRGHRQSVDLEAAFHLVQIADRLALSLIHI